MISASIADAVGNTPLVHLARMFKGEHYEVLAKLEYLNPLGSMKDRAARHVIESWLGDGTLKPGGHIVESSSGNFGIALAALAPLYGLRVTCVLDPNVSAVNLKILSSLGARIDMVSARDRMGGFLETRLARVRELTAEDPEAVWVNQYANDLCWQAHYAHTAREVIEQVSGPVDALVVAVSTTATLQGVSRRLREEWPDLKVIAADAHGSVVYGGAPAPRHLPGHGSSMRPELATRFDPDQVVHVREEDAIAGCRALLRSEGILAGASSGAVVSAIRTAGSALPAGSRVLTILPDRGERYMDLVYSDAPIFPRTGHAA